MEFKPSLPHPGREVSGLRQQGAQEALQQFRGELLPNVFNVGRSVRNLDAAFSSKPQNPADLLAAFMLPSLDGAFRGQRDQLKPQISHLVGRVGAQDVATKIDAQDGSRWATEGLFGNDVVRITATNAKTEESYEWTYAKEVNPAGIGRVGMLQPTHIEAVQLVHRVGEESETFLLRLQDGRQPKVLYRQTPDGIERLDIDLMQLTGKPTLYPKYTWPDFPAFKKGAPLQAAA